jgi:hypothetical protein
MEEAGMSITSVNSAIDYASWADKSLDEVAARCAYLEARLNLLERFCTETLALHSRRLDAAGAVLLPPRPVR